MSKRYPFAAIKETLLKRRDSVADFAIGRQQIPLPESIRAWIREHAELAIAPGNRDDMREFSEAASEFLAREYGHRIPAGHIVPTPGGRTAMTALIAAVLKPGDRVAVTVPGYPAFARLATHAHAEVLELPLDPARGFAPAVPAALASKNSPVRVISINYPNNPTGARLSADVVSSLRDLWAPGTVFFNDATYGPLVYEGQPRSLLAEARLQPPGADVIELHSFSKLFPLGPIAVSFLAGSSGLMDEISTYSEFAWSPLSRLQLGATLLGMQDTGRADELRRYLPARIRGLRDALETLGFSPYTTPAGLYVLCPVPGRIAGRQVRSADEAAARLIAEFDIAVVPLGTTEHAYLRFSSLYRDEDLAQLLAQRDLGLS